MQMPTQVTARAMTNFISMRVWSIPALPPIVEFVDPVIAAGTQLAHAEAMAASAENVSFRFAARRF
jgi:hypothetical protein